MAKQSSGGKKWTSKQGSWGNSFLIEGYSSAQEQSSDDKYNSYVANGVSDKAKKAFYAHAYSDVPRKKCPKCGSEDIKITRKGIAKSSKCNKCEYEW